MSYKTKAFGPIVILDAHECTRADRKLYLEIRFENEAGDELHVDLPMRVFCDPENGPEFDSEPMVDDEALTADQREVWDAFGDYCAAAQERRMEGDYD